MNKVKRGVGVVLAVLLGAFLLPAAPAYAADYTIQKADTKWWDTPVPYSKGAYYYCDPSFTSDFPATEAETNSTISVHVYFNGLLEATHHETFSLAGMKCGDVTFTGFEGYGILADGLTYRMGEALGQHFSGGAAINYGFTNDGRKVQVSGTATRTSGPLPFEPETGHDRPVAVPDTGVVPVGATEIPVPVLDNDTLPNGVAQLVVTREPSNGVAVARTSGADWDVLYTPRVGFVGQDTFAYEVTDRFGEVTQADVVIDVLGEEPPVVEPPTEEPPPVEPPVVDPPVEEPPVVVPPAPTPTPVPDPVEPFFPATGDDGPDHVAALQEVARTLAVPFGVYVLVLVGGLVVANRKGYI